MWYLNQLEVYTVLSICHIQILLGAKKEGIVGFFKGTGKGVLGLVFRPTGGIIDFTSATLFALQR